MRRPKLEYWFGSILLVVFALITFAWLNLLPVVFGIFVLGSLVYGTYYLLVKRHHYSQFLTDPYLTPLYNLDPGTAKQYVYDSFIAHGYTGNMEHTTDGMIDMWLSKNGVTYAVHFQQRAPRDYVREERVKKFYRTIRPMPGVHGILVTTTKFTNQAYYWGKQRKKRLNMIAGKDLARMLAGIENW